jgi:hypothetical protein
MSLEKKMYFLSGCFLSHIKHSCAFLATEGEASIMQQQSRAPHAYNDYLPSVY